MSVTWRSSWPSISPWFISLLDDIQNVAFTSTTVLCCVYTLNSFATSHAVSWWLTDAAWEHDVYLRCCWCSSACYINSSIYSQSSGCCPLTHKVPTVPINKNKTQSKWSDDFVTASRTKHYCGWTSKQALNPDTLQLSWGKMWCRAEW